MLILETLDANKKRLPVYAHDKVISLGDIAMYTDDEEVALGEVFESVKKKEDTHKMAEANKAFAHYRW